MKKVVHVSNANKFSNFSRVVADLDDVGDDEKQANELFEFLITTIPAGLYECLVARINKRAEWYEQHPNDYIDLNTFLKKYFSKGRKRR